MSTSDERLYYGTTNMLLDMDETCKIDPMYNTGKFFEFGNGFYLTRDRDFAESYIKYGIICRCVEALNSGLESEIQRMINGIQGQGHLHIYLLQNREQLDVKHFEDKAVYKDEIRNTIDMYQEDINYRPNRDITWGPVCGNEWDDYWKQEEGNRIPLEDFINICADRAEENMNSQIEQVCVHRNPIADKKDIFKHFLIKQSVDVVRL